MRMTKKNKALVGLSVAAAILVGGITVTAVAGESTERSARAACVAAVEGRLRFPGNARFNDVTVRTWPGGEADVSGTVDSENGFGAMGRSSFNCVYVPGDGATLRWLF